MRADYRAVRVLLLAALLVTVSPAAAQTTQEFRVDPAASSLLVQVGRGGLLSFAGHDHEVAAPAMKGTVALDAADMARSRVSIPAMKVTGRGEPAGDVPEVQRVMLSDRVLDVQRYPTITFDSTRIVIRQRSAEQLRLQVDGRLTLHGMSRPLSVPVDVRLSGSQITATGSAVVRQTEFGIRPVTAGAGTVRVKDEVTVTFTLVAQR
jgi:polyisoprenoid-binding protein YceI